MVLLYIRKGVEFLITWDYLDLDLVSILAKHAVNLISYYMKSLMCSDTQKIEWYLAISLQFKREEESLRVSGLDL